MSEKSVKNICIGKVAYSRIQPVTGAWVCILSTAVNWRSEVLNGFPNSCAATTKVCLQLANCKYDQVLSWEVH